MAIRLSDILVTSWVVWIVKYCLGAVRLITYGEGTQGQGWIQNLRRALRARTEKTPVFYLLQAGG